MTNCLGNNIMSNLVFVPKVNLVIDNSVMYTIKKNAAAMPVPDVIPAKPQSNANHPRVSASSEKKLIDSNNSV